MGLKYPLVSVIIPFYERVDWLKEAIESVLAQTYKNIEILVVNDGSKENVDSLLEEYGNKIKYIYKKNGGPATARNLGIEKSTGDYIAFLDSDDLWLPKKTERQIEVMEKNNAIWAHTAYETFDADKENYPTMEIKNIDAFNGIIYPKMLASNNLATPCIMVKGNFLRNNKFLRFNDNMRYGQDQYLWINIATENKIIAINECLVRVRIRGKNAALRAIVQIQTKSIIWNLLREESQKYKLDEIPYGIKIAFKLSNIGSKMLKKIEKLIKSNVCLEFISRILYIFPWILFKASFKKNQLLKVRYE